jgi:uncharacterized membrane protein
MSNLIAVAYDDVDTAKAVLRELDRLQNEGAITLEDAVIVERRDGGKVKLHQTMRSGAASAGLGAVYGGVIGLLFLAPFLGMAIGAAAGGATGAIADVGVDNKFVENLGSELAPGSAALVVLVRESTPDEVLPRISAHGGRVIHSSLSEEAEAQLSAALSAAAVP